jgi:PAS domain S-box-containing protein
VTDGDAPHRSTAGWSQRSPLLAALVLGVLVAGGSHPANGEAPPPSGNPIASAPDEGPDRERQRHVLILYTEPRLTPAIITADQALRTTLQGRWPGSIDFYTEYLDLSMFEGDAPERELYDLLRKKYAHRPLDLVVAAGSRALRIALRSRRELFSGAPIVFFAVDQAAAADLELDDRVTGVWLNLDWRGTLDAALRLQPRTRRAVVVAGTSPIDKIWLGAARQQLAVYQGRVEISYLTDLSMADMLERITALPVHTVLLAGTVWRDAAGRAFIPRDALRQIVSVSPVPVYGLADTLVGAGIVGGRVVSYESQGTRAAELGLQVLRGGSPAPIGGGTNVYMFDSRQLLRWRLDERQLPADSVLVFREPSAWERYKWYIVAAAIMLGFQTALITALLVNRAQRRRAQRTLAERLSFETLLSKLSASLGAQPAGDLDRHIDRALHRMVDALDLDRATLAEFGQPHDCAHVTYSAAREDVAPLPHAIASMEFPWIQRRLREGNIVRFARVSDLPDEAVTDRLTLATLGTRSLVSVPLMVGGAVVGAMSFATLRAEREWPDELAPRLRLLGEVVANALARRHAEHAVRESEKRFRRMADSAPLMVWLSGSDGRRTYVNRRWLDFTGRQPEEELGDGWLASIHPDDREASAKIVDEALAERRSFTMEYRLRGADGEYRSVLEHGVPRFGDDGTFDGCVGSAIDVTELRNAQQALVESDALRSAIFGSLNGRVAAIDRDGVIIAVNRSWAHFAHEYDDDPNRTAVGANYLDECRRTTAHGEPDACQAWKAIVTVRDGDAEHVELPCDRPPDGAP